jgi:hypothetical protein
MKIFTLKNRIKKLLNLTVDYSSTVSEESSSNKTYFIDIDGTILPHMSALDLDNKYKTDHIQPLLPEVIEFWNTFGSDDVIVLTTARPYKYKKYTLNTLKFHNIHYDKLLMNLANGPRILINDVTEDEPIKAVAYNVRRNGGLGNFL